MANFGVDPESASHTQLAQVSGGMKMKVVLAAAVWQNRRVLISYVSTNYFDRDGLGALVLAIKDYEGGVLLADAVRGGWIALLSPAIEQALTLVGLERPGTADVAKAEQ